jgi:dienelactone hydrolase
MFLWLALGVCLCAQAASSVETKRTLKYPGGAADAAAAWQRNVRSRLFQLLKLADLVAGRDRIPLNPRVKLPAASRGASLRNPAKPRSPFLPVANHGASWRSRVIGSDPKAGYVLKTVELNAMPRGSIRALISFPTNVAGPWPAVVCIHGHGGNLASVYDKQSIYKGFAAELAVRGYVTITTTVSQHEVWEKGWSLTSERLWDLMRCVDYLAGLAEVDPKRIGCAGLSLGGEMAMWLGAMDERVQATVSSGFLTRMDQMEQNHCPCWKFAGLRELVDFPDIYALTAPRFLLCQNGEKEAPDQFPPAIAREVMQEIKKTYADYGKADHAALVVHGGGHEVDLPSLLDFFAKRLQPPATPAGKPAQ